MTLADHLKRAVAWRLARASEKPEACRARALASKRRRFGPPRGVGCRVERRRA